MRKADNLPPSCAVVMKSGNLNFLEPSGPLQVCNGTALPLPYMFGALQIPVIKVSDLPICYTAQVSSCLPIFQDSLSVRRIKASTRPHKKPIISRRVINYQMCIDT